ncbi:hypothetical protein HPB48_002215 [Haemaphysalis longicornis]|uniref:Uncharacterized protein n=1 Tax=Haemaphysalis longicornis TaxID=44386 RepID=A0A9J6FGU3_HAELO|nr:hypothetical protein HPB48_002215 [Haemaphysalis longicornis]
MVWDQLTDAFQGAVQQVFWYFLRSSKTEQWHFRVSTLRAAPRAKGTRALPARRQRPIVLGMAAFPATVWVPSVSARSAVHIAWEGGRGIKLRKWLVGDVPPIGVDWRPNHAAGPPRASPTMDPLASVHIKSSFIMNGVCVRYRGWIDLDRLDGVGCLEYDEERGRAGAAGHRKAPQVPLDLITVAAAAAAAATTTCRQGRGAATERSLRWCRDSLCGQTLAQAARLNCRFRDERGAPPSPLRGQHFSHACQPAGGGRLATAVEALAINTSVTVGAASPDVRAHPPIRQPDLPACGIRLSETDAPTEHRMPLGERANAVREEAKCTRPLLLLPMLGGLDELFGYLVSIL